jgi:phenylacetate-CoA ligase
MAAPRCAQSQKARPGSDRAPATGSSRRNCVPCPRRLTYYRELYQRLPQLVEDVTLLPVTTKNSFMARFNEWTTDREATLEKVRAFVDNPDLIGQRFLDKYTIATTSGTSGTRGIFLLDDRSISVSDALAFRMLSSWLTAGDVLRIIFGGGRVAMVNAMGGHFASAIAATRLQRRRGGRVRVFPVNMPLPEMVAGLNAFRPILLASYASLGALLASEQEAGRLNIKPVLVVLSAEGLAQPEYGRIAKAFNAKVRHGYVATECPFLSYSCEHGWLHVNTDWVIFEPVDAHYGPWRPVRTRTPCSSATSPTAPSRFFATILATASCGGRSPVRAAIRCRRSACKAGPPTFSHFRLRAVDGLRSHP